MSKVTRLLSLVFVTAITNGCAVPPPEAAHPNVALARVIQSVKSTPYKRRETMVIENNGIPMAFDKWVPALSVTYEVQLTNGAIVTVHSDGKFENGSCVQLKTSADLPVAGSDPAYNHILGLLSSAKNC